jgi:hypothetical protein
LRFFSTLHGHIFLLEESRVEKFFSEFSTPKTFAKLIVTALGTALMFAAIAAFPSRSASAQETASPDSDWTATTPGAAVAEPDKAAPPMDIAGCWSGSIEDANSGAGTGALLFIQHKKKIAKGSGAHLSIGGGITGPVKGKVNSTVFVATFHGTGCTTVAFTGSLVGSYILRKCLGVTSSGSFDFTFDTSGASCNE